jgi:hypothetical protein
MGPGARTLYEDYNNDGDNEDWLGTINACTWTDTSTLSLASGYALDIGNTATPWRSYELILRVLNSSGATIDQWSFSLDTWYADTDSNNVTASIAWSTDNVNFTELDSYTTSSTGGVDSLVESDLSGTINASIADGAYLYLKFANTRVGESGSGARTLIDNWTVTAVSGGPTPVAPDGVDVAINGADIELTFDTVAGQNYQLLVSTDDMATFNPVGEAGSSGTGDGNPLTLIDAGGTPATGDKVFYRVEAN